MEVRRVVLTGGESTGKTTLARDLAARWKTAWAPEAAREVARARRGVLGPEDVPVIARAHVRLADEAARAAEAAGRPLVFLDQDLLSTVVYARHYYGSCPPWIVRLAAERRGDLYLLCAPDLPWESDGVRDRPGARDAIHALFEEALAAAGARTVRVSGAGAVRAIRASEAVTEALGDRRASTRPGAPS
ncbi:MAG TPA: ATP-binding protein [Thermoanaerobaculia bacterium]|jgi:NadR type nicotinamide-nucleotide adenylyltransferase